MAKQRVAITVGTFDFVHWGHLRLIQRCRTLVGKDGIVIVAINRDEFVEKFKGKKPVVPAIGRRVLLERLSDANFVWDNVEDEDLKPLLKKVIEYIPMSDIFLVVGSDWACKNYYEQTKLTQGWLDDHRIELVYFPYTEGISSTKIREEMDGKR